MIEPKVICEIGCNHMGSFELASQMIKVAANFCDADIIKFQKRDNKLLLSEKEYNAPHPVQENSYGRTYGEHREFLEFSIEQHKELKNLCEKYGKIYSSSVWDLNSAYEIISLKPKLIKIPSALNLNFELLQHILENYDGEIHISTGMTTEDEILEIINFFELKQKMQNLVIYYCKSTYPTHEKNLNLNYITTMVNKYGDKLKGIGFSGHHTGISVDIAALTLGAKYFERHFTLDRASKGTDHAASLEPDGLRRLIRNLREADESLQNWDGTISPEELIQRNKLKKVKRI